MRIQLTLLLVSLVLTAVHSYTDNDPVFCQQAHYREDCPTNPGPFDPVNEDDIIDVYYMQAPIFESVYGDIFGKLGGYHSALGFFNLNTKINYTAEYDAFFEVANGTFPNVVDNNNGTKDLVWCNAGITCAFPAINTTYWDPKFFSTASMTFMTSINGSVFNKFSPWMLSYNNTNPTQGAYFDCDTQILKRDYVNIYSEKPVPVDYETEKEDIVKYYSAFSIHKGESILDIIKNIFSVIGLKKYIYIEQNYYRLELNFPFVDLRYDYDALPGCPIPKRPLTDDVKVIQMGITL
ncbi:hypothetical protein PPL_11801 [Heterostelium album PN500]|uniref:Uncharacterized protein n=1 Tax=Heterostelium pallidum (strain ATCC 26659 / Pp 5 / PN500) TaxID=670386 RepID=D3BUI1_HETP5|nr:hypothetical protein PPL_11801 [Heterostelium album PN500]EFA74769.1 hypothetical protein PPL_11801 [Heterostelium album PN500]|eukprot:XP_020426903.1 hypothetical protein PPL_11801 [Heterostelium album PN500]